MIHVVLVGLMATGKSTVGGLVADTLGRTAVDSDAEVEVATGRSVREIWAAEGEAAFRRLETAVVASLLDRPAPSVIAVGGGAVLSPCTRERLRGGATVVWLRARPATLIARIAAVDEQHRPLLDDDPAGMLERMEDERRALYEEVADHVVDVDDRSPTEVATAVVAVVR